jgi:hypothetical protein
MLLFSVYPVHFCSSRAIAKEEKNLNTYLEKVTASELLAGCFEADGAFYYTVLALLLLDKPAWRANRRKLLQRLLITAHCRSLNLNTAHLSAADVDITPKPYATYKYAFVFFGLVNCFYEVMFKVSETLCTI